MEIKNTEQGLIIHGKVLKVGMIKQHRYEPQFYMQVQSPNYGTLKVMVSVGDISKPLREPPFEGDTVEFETKEIKEGWCIVTLHKKFSILESNGTVIQNHIICENKIATIKTLLTELLREKYISEQQYNIITRNLVEESKETSFFQNFSSPLTPQPFSQPSAKTTEIPENQKIPENTEKTLLCPRCKGKKEIHNEPCKFCNGTGGVSL